MPPPKLLLRYQAALNDPELNHHRDSIAMVDSLIGELLEDYEAGAGPGLWKQVQTVYGKLQVAERAGDTKKARELFEELGYVIEQGQRHSNQSERLLRLLAERRKHADSETRRKLSESMVYTVEEAYAFYTAMGLAIRKHVSSEAEQHAILNEIAAIAGDAGATGENRPAPPPRR